MNLMKKNLMMEKIMKIAIVMMMVKLMKVLNIMMMKLIEYIARKIHRRRTQMSRFVSCECV